eukprot:g62411.t1
MPLAELPLDLLQEALAWALTAKDLHSLALINREHLRVLDVVVRRRYAEAAGVLGAGCSLVLSKIRMLDEYRPTDSGSYEPLPLPPLWLLASRASDQEWEGITESNIFLENLDSVLKSECPELGPPGLPQRSCPAPRWAPFLSVRVDGRTANKKAVIVKLGFEHCSLADAKTIQAKTARPKGVVVLTAVSRLRDPVWTEQRGNAPRATSDIVCGHSAVMVLCAGYLTKWAFTSSRAKKSGRLQFTWTASLAQPSPGLSATQPHLATRLCKRDNPKSGRAQLIKKNIGRKT